MLRISGLDNIEHVAGNLSPRLASEHPELLLPHPRAHERGFVLIPWLDVDPGAALRVEGGVAQVSELSENVDTDGVRALSNPERR